MKNLYIFLLSIAGMVGFGQNIIEESYTTPKTVFGNSFENCFDRFGNKYTLKDIKIETINDKGLVVLSNSLLCTAGIFNLYFESGSGMEGSSTIETARRTVVCQVFSDLSNFINTPLKDTGNITKVNILIKNINLLNVPNNVLGLASGFYIAPYKNDVNFGGIADNEVWKTILTGKDSYTNVINSYSLSNTTPTASGSFYHGIMAFNFNVNASNSPLFNWNTNLGIVAPLGSYDLYTVMLHEITHVLGFASLIDSNGLSKLGIGNNYFSRYDSFLKNSTSSQNLVTNNITNSCSTLYNFGFNIANVPLTVIQPNSSDCVSNQTTCTNAIKFVGTGTTPVYTPNCYESGSSLSHFEDLCVSPYVNDAYFVMSNASSDGTILNSVNTKRFFQLEERNALTDIGYSLNSSFGNNLNVAGSYKNYVSSSIGINVAGINDGIIISGLNAGNYSFISNAGIPVIISNILINDTNATNFECLEDVFDTNATLNGLQRLSGNASTIISFFSLETGLHLLRYVPVNIQGKKGNITYVYVYINQSNCGNPNFCDLILNGNFEQYLALPTAQDQMNRACGWSSLSTLVTPDYYHLDSLNPSYRSGCNFFGIENDKIIGNKGYAGFYIKPNPDDGSGRYYETIKTKLTNPLIPNTKYQLSFDVSLAENVSGSAVKFQAYLSNTLIQFPPTYYQGEIPISNTNMLFTSPTFNNISDGWQRITFSFTTGNVANEQYLYLGGLSNVTYTANPPSFPFGCPGYSFLNNKIGLTYYYVDNVSLIQTNGTTFILPQSICVGNVLQNLDSYLSVAKPGGVFIGSGIINTGGIFSFNALSSNIGINTIIYRYTNQNGCIIDISCNIIVNPINLIPTFNIPSVCTGRPYDLPLISSNGISGTWFPATFDNINSGTYLFTPLGTCNNQTYSLNFTPTTKVTPLFTQIPTICYGSVLLPLQTTSLNGISGTWSPVLSNTLTTTYTFTPNSFPPQCVIGMGFVQMTISVLPASDPNCSSTSCQPNLTLIAPETNTTKNYKYKNWIKTITNYSIASGKDISMKAEDYIVMSPNTHIMSGSKMLAKIENCVVTSSRTSSQNEKPVNNYTTDDLKIYPNPTDDIINIATENLKLAKIVISSIEGKVIFEQKLNNEALFQFNLSNFTDGMYIITIETDEGKSFIKKLIKK